MKQTLDMIKTAAKGLVAGAGLTLLLGNMEGCASNLQNNYVADSEAAEILGVPESEIVHLGKYRTSEEALKYLKIVAMCNSEKDFIKNAERGGPSFMGNGEYKTHGEYLVESARESDIKKDLTITVKEAMRAETYAKDKRFDEILRK